MRLHQFYKPKEQIHLKTLSQTAPLLAHVYGAVKRQRTPQLYMYFYVEVHLF